MAETITLDSSFSILISNRIDRYTRAAQSSTNDLTTYNLRPVGEIPQTPKSTFGAQAAYPGSPHQSMHTNPSASNLADQSHQFSTLPPGAISGPLFPTQQARLNQSTSTGEMTSLQAQPISPTSTKDSGNFERHRRSSSMTINPSTISAPQPQQTPGALITGTQWPPDEQNSGLSRTTSSVALDGEPRIFPGVVSRSARRSSLRSGQVDDTNESNAHSGFRKGDTGSVAEEHDADAEE